MKRTPAAVLAGFGFVVLTALIGAAPAGAHPLGNFTVNVYTGIRVQPERLALDLVVDMAEIPTFQARRTVDGDGDDRVSDAESRSYATSACLEAAARIDVAVGGSAVPVRPVGAGVTFPPGTAGLLTLRLTCGLVADTGALAESREVVLRNRNYDDRVGWRELAAVGDGATLVSSDVGRASISERLAGYPDDLLTSPPDQRSATLRARPGGPPAPAAFGPADTGPGDNPAPPATRGVDGLTRSFTELVGRQDLTVGFGILALALSVVLGALHALAPGHGKTVMAAYLVGQRGSSRQVALIGLTVTATHTAGVLVLGIVLSTVTTLAPEDLYPWLALASGLLLAGIGAGLLRAALRRRAAYDLAPRRVGVLSPRALVPAGWVPALPDDPPHGHRHGHDSPHGPGHGHGHDAPHGPGHDAPHGHGHGHGHDPGQGRDSPRGHRLHGHERGRGRGHRHSHGPDPLAGAAVEVSWRGLVALGLAGGMVPSPSALVVLLGAIALGRAWFGVALVVGYGAGMAAVLTAAGLLLVRFRAALDRRAPTGGRGRFAAAARVLPLLTSALVLIGGAVLSLRAVTQL